MAGEQLEETLKSKDPALPALQMRNPRSDAELDGLTITVFGDEYTKMLYVCKDASFLFFKDHRPVSWCLCSNIWL